MEQNGWDKSDIYNVLHFQNSETDKKDEIKKISKILNSNKFNLYSLIWTDKKIYWLLNNKITFEQDNTGIMPSQTAQTTPIGVNTVTNESLAEKEHVDNIDIPAFLRQQAD